MSQTIVCACCGQKGIRRGRGLRRSCYSRMHRAGRLDEFQRIRPAQVEKFDWVVVERLLAGRDAVVHSAERDATARALLARGMKPHLVADACGMSSETANRMAVAA